MSLRRIVIPSRKQYPRLALDFLIKELSPYSEITNAYIDAKDQINLNETDFVLCSLASPLEYGDLLTFFQKYRIPSNGNERKDNSPLIVGGGIGFMNPEALSRFFDIVVIGPNTEHIIELLQATTSNGRTRTLQEATKIPNLYIPSKVNFSFDSDKRYISNIDINYKFLRRSYPVRFSISSSGDNSQALLMPDVGCKYDCSFCQLTNFFPYTEANIKDLSGEIKRLATKGFKTLKITSADTLQHSNITEILDSVKENGMGAAFGSARFSGLNYDILSKLVQIHSPRNNSYLYRKPPRNEKGSLTFGAESASDKLLRLINKGIKVQTIRDRIVRATDMGISNIGFYFLIGLPTEENEDLDSIAHLIGFTYDNVRNLNGEIYINVNPIIPSPNTPMQRVAMLNLSEYRTKLKYLEDKIKDNLGTEKFYESINFQSLDEGVYLFETVTMRGDRRVGEFIEAVYEGGIKLEDLTENLVSNYLVKLGLPSLEYFQSAIPFCKKLPWELTIYPELVNKEKKFFEHLVENYD